MKIGLLGDTHGNIGWMTYALNKFHREGITTILQVGDFGVWPGLNGALFLKRTSSSLKLHGQTMIVTPGNHEDYDQIKAVEVAADGFQHIRESILLAPRGHRWELADRSFVSLGGAPSVDRTYRIDRKLGWWADEAITLDDMHRVADGGYADVMVTHDAPFVPSIEEKIKDNPFGFKSWDLEYAFEGRTLMDDAFTAVKPKIFLHGHYHFAVAETVNECRVVGLSCDYRNHSLGVLDTDTLEAVTWDLISDYANYERVLGR